MNTYKYEIEDKFYPCATQDKWEINPISGIVRNKKSGKIIKSAMGEDGYIRLSFRCTLHRLLAETFIEKPYPEGVILHVHHIDGNKQNNNLDNLMWLTPKEHFNLPEWKELQSKVQTGLQAGEKNPMYGYQWSEEQNRKRSELMKEVYEDPVHKQNLLDGLSKRGQSWRDNISKAHKGKTLSEEHKKAISEANKGHKTSEETKKKLSLAHKGKKRPQISEALRGKPSGTSGKHWKLVNGKRIYYN